MFEKMTWYNKPNKVTLNKNSITVTAMEKTDFWQETHYGYGRDNGHFLYEKVKGDFTATVTFSGEYTSLYDQAGIMLRSNEKNWLKAGIEYTNKIHASVVMTRDYSDWSVTTIPDYSNELTMRVTRTGSAVQIEYLTSQNEWALMRLGYLNLDEECMVGIMCCSPELGEFACTFKNFTITNPVSATH